MTTIRATSRLVVVDVVVTDKNEQTIKVLQQGDFTLREDGKPQTITGFEVHAADAPVRMQPKPKLAPNLYTNAIAGPADAPVNILLIDAVNSAQMDQMATRKAVVRFLTTLPPGQRLAVFVLGNQLRMLQDFTSDTDKLLLAAQAYKPEMTLAQLQASDVAETAEFLSSASSNASPPSIAALYQMLSDEAGFAQSRRINETLVAFKQLIRAANGYPGRKNLIWLSAGFPLLLRPNSNPITAYTDFTREFTEISNMMTAAKVAVYPVDIRGLVPGGVPASSAMGMGKGQNFSRGFSEVNADALSDSQATMRELAAETGGRAFCNRNDVDVAMKRAVELGSTYYTLTYAPSDTKWNGAFRKIKVETPRKDVKLAYREGYYALDSTKPPAAAQLKNDIQLAMVRQSPISTGIIVQATVLERKPDGALRVAYGLAPPQLHLRDASNNPTTNNFTFAVLGWNRQGKIEGEGLEFWTIPPDAAAVAKMEKEGWIHVQTVKLPPDVTQIRVAVQDQTTGKIGTVDIPLTTPPQA